jgi:energy-coupling factor transporter ATP-binding protein EcfA2
LKWAEIANMCASVNADIPGDVVVRIAGLVHEFDDGTRLGFGATDITIRAGESVAIAGPNGCGKSTLLGHVLGLGPPMEGVVTTLGVPAHTMKPRHRQSIVGVLQNPDDQLFGPTVSDDLAYGPHNWGCNPREIRMMVERSLTRFRLNCDADRIAHALSSGERRRVALASAFVGWSASVPERVRLVVLDEPFEALDRHGVVALRELIGEIRQAGRTAVVFSTQDIETVPDLADRLIVLGARGHVVADGAPLAVMQDARVFGNANMAPPALLRLRDALLSLGVEVAPTFDPETMAREIVEIVRARRTRGGHRDRTRKEGAGSRV